MVKAFSVSRKSFCPKLALYYIYFVSLHRILHIIAMMHIKNIYPMEKNEKPIVGHIGVIGSRRITSRKRRRVLSTEEREKLVAQAKSAYEIRINTTERTSH